MRAPAAGSRSARGRRRPGPLAPEHQLELAALVLDVAALAARAVVRLARAAPGRPRSRWPSAVWQVRQRLARRRPARRGRSGSCARPPATRGSGSADPARSAPALRRRTPSEQRPAPAARASRPAQAVPGGGGHRHVHQRRTGTSPPRTAGARRASDGRAGAARPRGGCGRAARAFCRTSAASSCASVAAAGRAASARPRPGGAGAGPGPRPPARRAGRSSPPDGGRRRRLLQPLQERVVGAELGAQPRGQLAVRLLDLGQRQLLARPACAGSAGRGSGRTRPTAPPPPSTRS